MEEIVLDAVVLNQSTIVRVVAAAVGGTCNSVQSVLQGKDIRQYYLRRAQTLVHTVHPSRVPFFHGGISTIVPKILIYHIMFCLLVRRTSREGVGSVNTMLIF